jgi:hypothetical protein
MKVNRRLAAAVAIVGCLSLPLVGCGSNGGEPQANAKVANESKVAETKEAEPKAEAKESDSSKEAECQQFIALNEAGKAEHQEVAKEKGTAARVKKMGANYEKYAKQFAALELKDEKLQAFQERAVNFFQVGGKFFNEIVAAAEKNDEEAMKAATEKFEEDADNETTLFKEVEQYCAAK